MNSVAYITETEVKEMIKESVLQVLSFLNETRGALDSRMKTLAEMIWSRVEKGETNFVIDIQTINQYQDYFDATKPIVIKVINEENAELGGHGKSEIMKYDNRYEITINLAYVGVTLRPIPTIMHELTHMVNLEKYNLKKFCVSNDQFINEYLYYFRDTECNARVCEFSYYIEEKLEKNEPLDSNLYCQEYTSIHKLDKMYNILWMIYVTDKNTNPNYALLVGDIENMIPADQKKWDENFEIIKKNVYNRLYRVFMRYVKKLEKILKYAIEAESNKKLDQR